jgi:hypothetical protein
VITIKKNNGSAYNTDNKVNKSGYWQLVTCLTLSAEALAKADALYCRAVSGKKNLCI